MSPHPLKILVHYSLLAQLHIEKGAGVVTHIVVLILGYQRLESFFYLAIPSELSPERHRMTREELKTAPNRIRWRREDPIAIAISTLKAGLANYES